METYLNQLIKNFVFLKVTIKELQIINEWKSHNEGINTLNISHTFFKTAIEAFWINVIIELHKIIAKNTKKEKRTLYDWLNKATEHISSLKPIEEGYNLDGTCKYVEINPKQYQKMIIEHINKLDSFRETIKNIKRLRDKTTHSDPDYFSNPSKVFNKYPIDLLKINNLVKGIEEILSYHHIVLFRSSLDFNIKTHGHVDNILRHAETFQKIRTNQKVINAGIRPIDYIKSNNVEF